VDAPWIFWACWKIISPWIDPKTAEKIKFITKAELKNYISEDTLLVEYGGKNPWTYKFDPSMLTPNNNNSTTNNKSETSLENSEPDSQKSKEVPSQQDN
jgi:hypothetical protein